MFRKIFLLAMAGVLTTALSAVVSAETTEGVLGKLLKQHGEMKTYETDTKTIMKSGEMAGSAMTGHMATQVVEKDGKPSSTLMNWKQKMKGPDGTDQEMTMVNDGEFVWMEMKDPASGQVMVMKMKPDSQKVDSGDAKQFTDQYNLKLVGEEDFDGQKMWVLEGMPKVGDKAAPARSGMGMRMGPAAPPDKVRISVGQKDNFVHRFVQIDKAGKETSEMQFTNIKANQKVDPKLFKYTPPPGARVMDMTKGMPGLNDLKGMIPEGAEGGGE